MGQRLRAMPLAAHIPPQFIAQGAEEKSRRRSYLQQASLLWKLKAEPVQRPPRKPPTGHEKQAEAKQYQAVAQIESKFLPRVPVPDRPQRRPCAHQGLKRENDPQKKKKEMIQQTGFHNGLTWRCDKWPIFPITVLPMRKFSDLNVNMRTLDIELEGMAFSLHLVADTDTLLDRLLAKGADHDDVRDERIPYWADLWPSAHALGRFLIREKAVHAGMRVVEIGCGLGLPGLVGHNWKRNLQGEAEFKLMDWREPDPSLAADLVLASDVAYEARAFDPLPRAFHALCRPGGRILVAEPDRVIARPFLRTLPEHGFAYRSDSMEGELEGLAYRVNIFELRPV